MYKKNKTKAISIISIIILASISMSFMPHAFCKTSNKTDWDNDGIPDAWESKNLLNPYCPKDAALDLNHDGQTTFQEFKNNRDPWDLDSDNDKIANYAETMGVFGFYSDPLLRDTDRDGLSDLIELIRHIDAANESQMAQLFPKIINRSEVRDEIRFLQNRHLYTLNPTNWDTDGDDLSDGNELQINTSPMHKDTDRDGLNDGREVHELKTDPLLRDTDGDGIIDPLELIGIDGIIYNPLRWDTDGDGISDGEEVFGFGFAPIKPARYAVSYEDFLRGDHIGKNVTIMARVSKLVGTDTLELYYIYLSSLNETNRVLVNRIKIEVENKGGYRLIRGERIFVDERFGFSLEIGDIIVVTGKSENILAGGIRPITVGKSGSLYLLLGLEEAQDRWLPSRKYIRMIHTKPNPPEIEPLTQEEILKALLREQDEKIEDLNRQLQEYRIQSDELKKERPEPIPKESENINNTLFGYMPIIIGIGAILISALISILIMKFSKQKSLRDFLEQNPLLRFCEKKKSKDGFGIDNKITNKTDKILNQSKSKNFDQSNLKTNVEKIGNKTVYK